MKRIHPPSWAIRFLHWFCRPTIADEIEGDLTEEFYERIKKRGAFIAKFSFVIGVLSFIRPFALHQNFVPSARPTMLGSYLVIAWRSMKSHKLFTVINIVGLSFSLSVALTLVALISDTLEFDHFHKNKDRIRRVISTVYDPARRVDIKATAPLPLAERLLATSGVESVVRINRAIFDDIVADAGNIPVEGYFVDPGFFDVFSFPFIEGSASQALGTPYSIVLTRSTAMKLFNSTDIIGRVVQFKSFGLFSVQGIIEDIPRASHMQFDVVSSFSTAVALERDNKILHTSDAWDNTYRTYVYYLQQEGYDDDDIRLALKAVSHEIFRDPAGYRATFDVQSLLSIVPGRDLSMQIGPKILPWPLIILASLTLVITLSACFNYTNLSIARALRRAKEVALRKISGAKRREVAWQFLIESVMISLFSLVAATWIFTIIRHHFLENIPAMNRLADLELSFGLLLRFIVLAIVVGVIAGLLPALLISKIKILDALKQFKTLKLVGPVGIRNALVIFQLTLSMFLITGIGIIYKQYQFAVNRDLGFDKENILSISLNGLTPDKLAAIEQLSDVKSISYSSIRPGTSETEMARVIMNDGLDSLFVYTMSASPQLADNFGLKFIAGSNFPASAINGREQFTIINRKFLSLLKVTSPFDALGKTILCDSTELQVIGVVEDFPYTQIDDLIGPVLIRNRPQDFKVAFVKIYPDDVTSARSRIEEAWTSVAGGKEFQARFYDEEIEQTYVFYMRLIRVFGYVGSLAFVIAVLGLLGMTTYSTETRKKEIGIRKVLGAHEGHIIFLISKGFVRLMAFATIVALPCVYLLFDLVVLTWSAYRISIGAIEMSVGPVVLLLVGVGAIASQTLRAARANPVETLKSE